jgi:hypothetical protein
MSRPNRFLIRMVVFLAIVAAVAGVLLPQLQRAFLANAPFNGLILGVLLLGILYTFRQVLLLRPEVDWLERIQQESSGRQGPVIPSSMTEERPPRLLAPLANMVGDRKGRLSLSAMSMRSLMDSIQSRIGESHEISRYIVGLLVFLGLLGTFWGLLDTVTTVGAAISELQVTGGDAAAMFGDLKRSLQAPLSGMGTAFSSSLFGLAGSLVLGFLELQAGQAHNRFVNELEEWLSGITKLSSGVGGGEGGESVSAYTQALLEQTADSLDSLQRTIASGEEERDNINRNLMQLTERVSTLTDQMRTEQSVLLKLAETQSQLKPVLNRIAEQGDQAETQGGNGLDEATKDHIRNLDVHLSQMVSDANSGREQIVREMRNEIRLLARTIAAIAEEGDQQHQQQERR